MITAAFLQKNPQLTEEFAKLLSSKFDIPPDTLKIVVQKAIAISTRKTNILVEKTLKDKFKDLGDRFKEGGILGLVKDFIKNKTQTKIISAERESDLPSIVPKKDTPVSSTNISDETAAEADRKFTEEKTPTSIAPTFTPNIDAAEADRKFTEERKEPMPVVLAGITDEGVRDLEEKLPKILKHAFKTTGTTGDKETEKDGFFDGGTDKGEGGLLDEFRKGGLISLFKKGGLGRKAARGLWEGTKGVGRGAWNLGQMKAGTGAGAAGGMATAGTVLAGLAIGGTAGTALAKNEAFSEWAYGSKEAGKKAMEEYDTGPLGLMAIPQLFHASYDAMKAIGEAKKARERSEETEKKTIPLDIKAMMLGYKNLDDFGKAVSANKEKRHMYWDDQKQAVITSMPDGTLEVHKFIYGKGFQGKPEIIKSNKSTTPTTQPPQPPTSSSTPSNATPTPAMAEGGVVIQPTTALVGEAGPEAVIPLDKYFNSQDATLNNKTLASIASNTGDTNNALTSLTNAIFKLAQTFAKQQNASNNNIFINGQKQEGVPSASQIAASNVDPIRNVRAQFAI